MGSIMFNEKELSRIIRNEGGVSRRFFMAYSAALASLPFLGVRASAADRKVTFASNPFTLGVASGDPDATSVVLWTKLAPKPTDPDGGMKPEHVKVVWEIAEDEKFTKEVRTGTSIASPQLGHSVHVEVEGLKNDRWYWYRFRAGDATSPIGRTRTLPALNAEPEKLNFAFVSCQHYEQGLYTAYEHMMKDENIDLVFHLGDYIYEYPNNPKALARVRAHSGPKDRKIQTLDEYRERHVQYRLDPALHGMHAKCPWFVTWDDHEFDNNYANDISEKKGVDPIQFLIQRAAAYQAYYEMMPLRKNCLPKGPDMKIYRKASFGRLAEFLILDTRQYRTDQPNNDGIRPLNEEALKPTNTLLGKEQRGWLQKSLIASQAEWNVLAQQVMMGMAQLGKLKDTDEGLYSMDQWPGAAQERMDLMKFIQDRKVPNPIVLTGDIHSNWVNNLHVDDRQPDTPVVATEFVATSITSGGNGIAKPKMLDELLKANPFIQFHNRERGYVRCTVTPEKWVSDYIVVEDVLKPNGKVVTRESFVVESGKPGAKKI
jgi:alkaline phosphatase D